MNDKHTCITCGAEHGEACLKQGHFKYRLGEDDSSGVPAPIMVVLDYNLARSQERFNRFLTVMVAIAILGFWGIIFQALGVF